MSAPRVSVVIPTYRRPALLLRAITSVGAAAAASGIRRNVEVVVVDDEASEQTRRAVEQADDGGMALSYMRHPAGARQGAAACRNHGVRSTAGDLVYWLDDDDEFLPNRFDRSLPLLLEGSCDLVLERVIRSRDGEPQSTGTVTGPSDDVSMPPFQYLLTGGQPTHVASAATAFTRQIFDAVGGQDEGLRFGEDGEFMLRLCLAGRAVLLSGRPVAHCHEHGANTSRSDRLHYWHTIASLGALYRKVGKSNQTHQVEAKRLLSRSLSGKLDYALSRYRWDDRGLRYRYAGGLQALRHFPPGCLTWRNVKSIGVWLLRPAPSRGLVH